MKEYTKHQQGYIDSVDGAAHITAVVLIGSLDERIAELEADIVTRRLDYTEDCKRLDARIEELELRIADESRACALFQSHIRELEAQLAAAQERTMAIRIIFDGPPGPDAGQFVEVETDTGESISIGEWIDRKDGYWALRIAKLPAPPEQEE